MDCDGYVKVSRAMLGSGLFKSPNVLALWMWCLLRASWKETKDQVGNEVVLLKPGQLVFKRRLAAEALGMNEYAVYRCLKSLVSRESIVTKKHNKFTIVTIVNWDSYQGLKEQCAQETHSKRQEEHSKRQETHSTYNKAKEEEGKKGRKKEVNTPPLPPHGDEVSHAVACEVGGSQVTPVIKTPDCPHDAIVRLWNETLPELPHVRVFGEKSKTSLRSRWRASPEFQDLAWWEGFFKYIRGSDFLMGRKTEWKATLEWVLRPGNFEKVVNGNYENSDRVSTGSRITDQNMRAGEEFLNEIRRRGQIQHADDRACRGLLGND